MTWAISVALMGLAQGAGSVNLTPLQQVVKAGNETGLDLLRAGWIANKGNQVLSPAGVQACIASCIQGAHPEVARGLCKALHLDDKPTPIVAEGLRSLRKQLSASSASLRTALWVRGGANPKATAHPADILRLPDDPVAIVDEANRWASVATNGLVKKVLGRVSQRTGFLVTSACAFEATWRDSPTSLRGRRAMKFHPSDSEAISVDGLSWHGQILCAANDGVEAVRLPYRGDRTSLLVILPNPDKTVAQVVGELNSESFSRLFRDMNAQTATVELPKFAISSSLDLVRFLEANGAELACFPGDRFPSFAPGCHLTQVAHATRIEVDERGTRAASASAAVGGGFGGSKTITVNRPFLFFICESSTEAILFAGICTRP